MVQRLAQRLCLLPILCGRHSDVWDVRELKPQMLRQNTCVERIMEQGDAGVSFIWYEEYVRGVVDVVCAQHCVPAMKSDRLRSLRDSGNVFVVGYFRYGLASKDHREVRSYDVHMWVVLLPKGVKKGAGRSADIQIRNCVERVQEAHLPST